MAHQHKALNLSQGFPGFNCSPKLIELVHAKMIEGLNQYAPMPGVLKLREQIALKTEEVYGAIYNPETEITITAGATQAIFTAIHAVVRESDEVIVIEPAYDCYAPAIELASGKTVFFQLNQGDYRINWTEFQKLINPRTRMIIINSPHNPTGTVLSANDLQKLDKLTKNTDIIILSDEVYEHILFDNQIHQSVCRYPNLANRSFVVSSFGKTYHTTGWKLGYCLAPENLMKEFRKVHQFNVFSSNTPIQHAYAEFLNHKDEYQNLNVFYQSKRDFFCGLFKGSKFTFTPSEGTYFQLLNYSNITKEKDIELAKRLVTEAGVASIPVSVFYHKIKENYSLRFCFAKENVELEKAAEQLLNWANKN